MIYIIGDTHGEIEFWKLGNSEFKKQGLDIPTEDDTIIQVGDLGFIWDPIDNVSNSEKYLKEWSGMKPWTLLTAGGNHENWNRVFKLPKVPWPGGELAYKYTNNIYYAIRGGVYEIGGKTFFFIGGASSHDKMYRTEGVSWWEEELLSMAEMDAGVAALDAVNMEVDYVIAHTFPREIVYQLGYYTNVCPVSSYLSQLLSFGLKFKHWYGGHFHIDKTVEDSHGTFHCVYDKILELHE